MTMPQYVVRSYGGGAVVAQLTQPMGPQDASFAISPTINWTEADGNPLGTAGPFTVVIDRFTASVEKILCSSINPVTGVVQVYLAPGFSGRGYDGTVPQAHVPGGSTSGVQTCWSSAEAMEANQAVFNMLGQSPSNGQVFVWEGGPTWGAVGGLSANPIGSMHQTVAQSIASNTTTLCTNMVSDFVVGMTFASNTLVMATPGYYQVTTTVGWSNSNAGLYGSAVYHNGTLVVGSGGSVYITPDLGASSISYTDYVNCAANDTIGLGAYQDIGGPATTSVGSAVTGLQALLVSQT